MGLIGIIIAMIVNIFIASLALMFTISVLGVFHFYWLNCMGYTKCKADLFKPYGDPLCIQFAISLYSNFTQLILNVVNAFGQQRIKKHLTSLVLTL